MLAGPTRRFVLAIVHSNLSSECLDQLAGLRKALDDVPVVVIAGNMQPELAFRLGRAGIASLVELPMPPDVVCGRCFQQANRRSSDDVPELAGDSPAMRRLRERIVATSQVRSTVLITGETGTGKSLIARAIHRLSCGGRGLVQVNCPALAPSLIESELFGHERGSFTGAVASRPGRFELADRGDIFLDEIGELDLALQSKFLRVLEDREFERVGGMRTIRMNARVIAATSRDLASDVRAGRFRADLYYRLRLVHLHVPPLRERPADLPSICEALVRRIALQLGVPTPEVSGDLHDRLAEHFWPGNVRELRNLLEEILVHRRPMRLEPHHVQEGLRADRLALYRSEGRTVELPAACNAVLPGFEGGGERAELVRLLVATGGNIARVARRMAMPRSTVRHKIWRYGLGEYIPRD
jgi:DNA-binding NtrC family response regulator